LCSTGAWTSGRGVTKCGRGKVNLQGEAGGTKTTIHEGTAIGNPEISAALCLGAVGGLTVAAKESEFLIEIDFVAIGGTETAHRIEIVCEMTPLFVTSLRC